MKRFLARGTQAVIDLAVLSAAYWLAFLFRFEFTLDLQWIKLLFFTWPYVILLQYVVFILSGIPSIAWRYVAIRDAVRILQATVVSVGLLVGIRIVLGSQQSYARFVVIPLGILAMDFVLAFVGMAGIRVVRRIIGERTGRGSASRPASRKRTLLVGAGQAGAMVAKEISQRPGLGIEPVGFVDDDPMKHGSAVNGIKVLGSTEDLSRLCEKTKAEQILITIANAPGREIRRIRSLSEAIGIETKIIPGVYEIVDGKVNLQRIRSVAIDDLLGREPVALDEALIAKAVRGRRVMVTGAGGSIGSELCRQLCSIAPAELCLVEQAENSLFHIHSELREAFAHINVAPCVADICDAARMRELFAGRRPETVFHAAAHKHVPMMEWNPAEALKNNVLGTRIVADLAYEHGVERFVLISTDKAVNPTSVMGATKRIAEIYVQGMSSRGGTAFVAVRFGNVLGSAGSVVPFFKAQIEKGGPITVTHPEVQRYFMTIPEACQLVLQAGVMGSGGEIFTLDMGEPVKIVELARDLIRLSGLQPDEDIEIEFTELRPGEKLFEELLFDDENADRTNHPKVFTGRLKAYGWQAAHAAIMRVEGLVADGADGDAIRLALGQLVPEYRRPGVAPSKVEVMEAAS